MPEHMKPVNRVVKLGGSLMRSPHLQPWLQTLAGQGGSHCVIVPGGGAFADRVRSAQQQQGFNDGSAHHLALLSMIQYGHLLLTLNPALQPAISKDDIESAWRADRVPVWLPVALLIDQGDSGVRHSWDWTSDSIALWLARQLDADLCLVKPVALDQQTLPIDTLQRAGMLDAAFAELLPAGDSRVHWFGPEQYERFELPPPARFGRTGTD